MVMVQSASETHGLRPYRDGSPGDLGLGLGLGLTLMANRETPLEEPFFLRSVMAAEIDVYDVPPRTARFSSSCRSCSRLERSSFVSSLACTSSFLPGMNKWVPAFNRAF